MQQLHLLKAATEILCHLIQVQVSFFPPSNLDINLVVLFLSVFSFLFSSLYVVVKMEYWFNLSNLIVHCLLFVLFIMKIVSNFLKW